MSSGTTAQDPTWRSREQGEEAQYIREKARLPKGLLINHGKHYLLAFYTQEQAQLAALHEEQEKRSTTSNNNTTKDAASSTKDRDFEGGFGGQEDLEDRYATTSGEH
ncbi:uncharacterized protein F5891DRAFT_286533 [Suillus fuscotomentosus]|uniref:Uncharacterized protein n=1 Tax=Suillus fuscotomentosus TaxID=1912939 RepID=A0AAD4E7J1_9AGAM|nr:uncharacterized protein F5891DRAFT_286533 [Suillus fuscotomentosus]KAG1900751.1 hypothetical protein F5891DRAFT_286533 [Suillus fuscotomentosus]